MTVVDDIALVARERRGGCVSVKSVGCADEERYEVGVLGSLGYLVVKCSHQTQCHCWNQRSLHCSNCVVS